MVQPEWSRNRATFPRCCLVPLLLINRGICKTREGRAPARPRSHGARDPTIGREARMGGHAGGTHSCASVVAPSRPHGIPRPRGSVALPLCINQTIKQSNPSSATKPPTLIPERPFFGRSRQTPPSQRIVDTAQMKIWHASDGNLACLR